MLKLTYLIILFFRKDRVVGEHGGVLTYYKHDLGITLIEGNTASKIHEVQWMHAKSNLSEIFIANVYHPPPSDNNIFECLATDTEFFQTGSSKSKVFIFGD